MKHYWKAKLLFSARYYYESIYNYNKYNAVTISGTEYHLHQNLYDPPQKKTTQQQQTKQVHQKTPVNT